MEPDPHNKATTEYFAEAAERKRSRRGWVIWLFVLGISLLFLYLFNHGLVSGAFGIALAIAGIIGVFLFLAFLSTKPFGHSDFSWRWWWFR
jgi:hypothetical protein